MAQPKLSPTQREQLQRLEVALRGSGFKALNKTPKHIRELGKIIRRSVRKGTLVKFKRFLRRHEIRIARQDLEAFRDYLIINRVDLKDLEPEARARLRARTLLADDPRQMTVDYRNAAQGGGTPHCRDCRWFVQAPHDGTEGGDKSCVAFGTKGSDSACFGFTLSD